MKHDTKDALLFWGIVFSFVFLGVALLFYIAQ